jgi:hypothetical protein
MNEEKVPWAISAILTEAFNPSAHERRNVRIMILGFKEQHFSMKLELVQLL